MSDKPPFARVVAGSLYVSGYPFPLDASGYSLGTVVDLLNAAADARSAKLLGAVVELIRRHETDGPIFTAVENLCADVFKLHPDGEAVAGDIACGLAFDLGALQAHFDGTWAVLMDQLLAAGGESSEAAWLLIDALGIDRFRFDTAGRHVGRLPQFTDDELRAECRRRGWHPEMGLAPRMSRGWEAGTLEVDPALGPDETVLAQVDGGQVRHIVRIQNIDASGNTGGSIEGLDPGALIREYQEHLGIPSEFTRYEGGVDAASNCANLNCSRYGTRHPGIPCDTRRARR